MAERKPKADPKADPKPDPAEPSFEAALAEVEAIIERIETGQSGLERSIGEYEKGVRLLARCRGMLKDAEQRIEDVTSRLQQEGERPSSGD
ncbi:MAG: exodeoxyribonuclease VII small subunit [Phycisphaerales bacterium]